jgi:uncharacterized membrane protein YesL
MSRFAERNPKLWSFLEKVSALVLGSLAFWLFLAPIVTWPAAVAGLFAAVSPLVRGGHDDWFVLFWKTFKQVFGRALTLGLLSLLLLALLYVDIRFFWALGHPLANVAAFFMGSLLALLLMISLYAWPLLAWYPQPLPALLRRAFLLAAAHPLPAVGGWLVSGGVVLVLSLLPGRLLFLLPLFGPGLVVAILGAFAWIAMRRYVGEDESLG